jgi:methyl-accepting chemotaxis protein
VTLNHEVLNNLEEIATQVRQMNEVMGEIATASDQQQHGVEQPTVAVEQLNKVTQQTAANSEESASAAEELSSQADVMQDLVTTFQLSKAGHSSPTDHGQLAPPAGHAVPVPSQSLSGAAGKKNSKAHGHVIDQTPEEVIPFYDDEDIQNLYEF